MIKKTILEELAADCITDIRAGMDSTKTNASGKTSSELFSEVSDSSIVIYANRRGFANTEAGQNPGKRPKNFREIIQQWILDKGLSIAAMPYSPRYKGKRKFSSASERGLYYASGAIAWNNKTKGSRLYKSGGRNDVFSPAVERLFNRVTEAAADDIMMRIDAVFINTAI
jgi:hypothetical protein